MIAPAEASTCKRAAAAPSGVAERRAEQGPFARVDVAVVVAQDRQPPRRQHRRRAGQADIARIALAEQRGDHHAVEVACDRGLRGAQVSVAVQVQQAGIRPLPQAAGDGAGRDAAVPAHQNRDPPGPDRLAGRVGDVPARPQDRVPVPRPRMRRIGGEHLRGQVTGVGYHPPRLAQPVRQAHGAQRRGPALQSAVMRASAARYPDYRQCPGHAPHTAADGAGRQPARNAVPSDRAADPGRDRSPPWRRPVAPAHLGTGRAGPRRRQRE
jgi:hypothetical protein